MGQASGQALARPRSGCRWLEEGNGTQGSPRFAASRDKAGPDQSDLLLVLGGQG